MKRVIRVIGVVLGSLLGIVLLAAVVLYLIGNARLNKVYDFPASNITLSYTGWRACLLDRGGF
jgi:uncharacterized membrane protein required for colicin V production